MVPHVAAVTALIFLSAAPSTIQTAGYANGVCTESPSVRDRPPDVARR
jgi:hypothetical protein